jgi:lipid-binding SYLF domain-containing protein
MKLRSLVFALIALTAINANAASATSKEELNRDADASLHTLMRTQPAAEAVAKQAKAVLIFPSIVKAGLIFGGAYGEGELKVGDIVRGEVLDGYYNSITASWGLQAGAQSYGYAVFLMNDKALQYVHDTHGWEIGVGPTVVVVNEGVAKNLSTTTLKDDAYAFIFDQKGLMASLSLEGTKVSRIHNP